MYALAKCSLPRRVVGLLSPANAIHGTTTRSRLLSTLAILEQRDGQLNQGSLNAFAAAKQLGGTVHGFVAGSNVSAAAQEAAKVEGVEQIIKVDSSAYEKVSKYSGLLHSVT